MTRTEPNRAVGEAAGDPESRRLSPGVDARGRLKQLVRESRYAADERAVAEWVLRREDPLGR